MSLPNEVIDLTGSFTSSMPQNIVIDLIEDTDDSIIYCSNNLSNLYIEKEAPNKKLRKPSKTKTKVQPNNCQLPQLENNKTKDKSVRCGDCPICWDELGKNSLASTKCGHVYCMKCLEQSLKVEKKCPTCRRVLRGSNAYHPLYLN